MNQITLSIKSLHKDFLAWVFVLKCYHLKRGRQIGAHFERGKDLLVSFLLERRGARQKSFLRFSMAGLVATGLILAPILSNEYPGLAQSYDRENPSGILNTLTADNSTTETKESQKPRDGYLDYKVETGDTLGSIGQKFDVSLDSLRWANEDKIKNINTIAPNDTLKIPPVTGLYHTVKSGETVYSIAKKYYPADNKNVDSKILAQQIVDWPYNTFANDEIFSLTIGQKLFLPNGVKPAEVLWSPPAKPALVEIPNLPQIIGGGQFLWPTGGTITQRQSWYHTGVDIANGSAPGVAAADSGRVIEAQSGWNGGYGNLVRIDHGNGYITYYAHLAGIYVSIGQSVNRGQLIGQMGSTGRSTGTHLHFEVRKNGAVENPLSYLK